MLPSNVIVAILVYCYSTNLTVKAIATIAVRDENLFEFRDRNFTMRNCMERSHPTVKLVSPPPDCNLVREEDPKINILTTLYRPIVVKEVQPAILCKALQVEITTYQNFFGAKSKSTRKIWVSPDSGKCHELVYQRPTSDVESDIQGATQFGKPAEQYAWCAHATTTTVVYYIFDTKISVDVNQGLVAPPAYGTDSHSCQYSAAVCELRESGVLFWEVTDDYSAEIGCPYRIIRSELCIMAKIGKQAGDRVQVTCPSSSAIFHFDLNNPPTHESICGHVDHLYVSTEKDVVSFNTSLEDSSKLKPRPTSFKQMLQGYSASRIVCSTEDSEELCGIRAQPVNHTCRPGSTVSGCIPGLDGWDRDVCHLGICRIGKFLACKHESIKEVVNITMESDLPGFIGKVESLSRAKSMFCIDVYRDRIEVFDTGFFDLRLDPKPDVLASFVNEKSAFPAGHTIAGFTRKQAQHCSREGLTSLIADSYPQAVLKLISLGSYEDKVICMSRGSDAMGAVFTTSTFTESSDTAEFVFQYTGRPSTNTHANSFVGNQLSYLYSVISRRDDRELHQMKKQVCKAKYREYLLDASLRAVDPAAYVALVTDGKSHGYIRDLKVHSWPCTEVNRFRLLPTNHSGTCFSNIPAEIDVNGTTVRGYVNRLTRRFANSTGVSVPCEHLVTALSIGAGTMLLANESGTYLIMHEIQSESQSANPDMEFTVDDLINFQNVFEDRSFEQRIEDVERLAMASASYNGLTSDSTTYSTKSDGSIGSKIEKALGINTDFIYTVIFITATILIIVAVIFLARCCGCRCCCDRCWQKLRKCCLGQINRREAGYTDVTRMIREMDLELGKLNRSGDADHQSSVHSSPGGSPTKFTPPSTPGQSGEGARNAEPRGQPLIYPPTPSNSAVQTPVRS